MSFFGTLIFPPQSGLSCPGAQPCNFFGCHARPIGAMTARPVMTAGVHKSFFSGGGSSPAPAPAVGGKLDRAG